MDHGISLVLDSDAIRAYAAGDFTIGLRISELPTGVKFAAVPVLCLAEAYRTATSEEALILDLLSNLPAVIVTPVNPDDAPFLGGWTGILGTHDLAHAALDAAAHKARLLTSQRAAVHKVLPEGWPIIDV